MTRYRMRALLGSVLLLGGITAAHATTIGDAANDFIPSYTGAHGGDLDVTGISVVLDGNDFVLTANFAAALGTTSSAFYVWGVNRGTGTAGFAAIGETGVLFDSVIVLRPNGGANALTLLQPAPPAATALDASVFSVSGSTLTARISASLLPSRGFDLLQYGFNLWPRDATQTGNAAISDFAPDNSTIVATVPEPATFALLLAGLAGVAVRRRATIGAA